MKQKTNNQERSRKYGGSASFVDSGTPSKAPRQDEQDAARANDKASKTSPGIGTGAQQGISNRPAGEEHAFPDPSNSEPASNTQEETTPGSAQQGGPRGGA